MLAIMAMIDSDNEWDGVSSDLGEFSNFLKRELIVIIMQDHFTDDTLPCLRILHA